MLGTILNAVINECSALLNDDTVAGGAIGGTVLLETDFMKDHQRAYNMPLILLELEDAPESGQWIGGSTRMEWLFGLNSYEYEPDAFNADQSDFSTSLLDVIDTIRKHFSLRNWYTQEMIDTESNYGFRFTLSGIQKAMALQRDGLIVGFKIVFDSIAIDDSTDSIQWSDEVLEEVQQTGLQINSSIFDNLQTNNQMNSTYPQTLNIGVSTVNPTQKIPGGSYVNAIALKTMSGSPSLRIGITPGGDEVMMDATPGNFYLVQPQMHYDADTTFYYTQTGDGLINVRIDLTRNYFNPLNN